MVQLRSSLRVVDNSGCLLAVCIGLNRLQNYGTIGDIVTVSLTSFTTLGKIQRGTVSKGIIVRVKKENRLLTGDYISFGDNAIILINSQFLPQYSRLFGPVSVELFVRNTIFNFKIKYLRILALTKYKI